MCIAFLNPGVAPSSFAQDATNWKTWLDGRAAGFSGVALVARGDTIEIVAGYGLADRASGRKNTADTRFNLGSINKTFTAIAIAQLIQQGRLSLDDTLAKHLPNYPNTAAAAKITIRDLLTHRSGVAQFMGADFGEGSVAEMTRLVAAEPLAFEPGTQQQYSNGGYVVLGRVVEVVSGMSYSAYVSEKIYRPAGMTNTGFLKRGDPDTTVALGYFSADAQGRPAMGTPGVGSNPPRPGNPAGGGYSTVTDMFRFARALRNGRLLDLSMTDYVVNGTFSGKSGPKFGFALREQMAGTRRFIGNGGGAPGVNAEFRFEPAGEYTVVVLANSNPPAATRLLTDILNRLGASEPAAEPADHAPQNRASSGELRAEIEALHTEMVAAFRENPENVARYYARNARIIGGGRMWSGDEIQSYWSQVPAGASQTLEILDAGGAPNEPWVLGRSTLGRPGGPAMTTTYLAILRREPDGKLKYYLDMFTRAPSPPAQP